MKARFAELIRPDGSTGSGYCVSGSDVFQLHDSKGIPLSIQIESMRELSTQELPMFFNVEEFIVAAKRSKNYTKERVYGLLDSAYHENISTDKMDLNLLQKTVDRVWEQS